MRNRRRRLRQLPFFIGSGSPVKLAGRPIRGRGGVLLAPAIALTGLTALRLCRRRQSAGPSGPRRELVTRSFAAAHPRCERGCGGSPIASRMAGSRVVPDDAILDLCRWPVFPLCSWPATRHWAGD